MASKEPVISLSKHTKPFKVQTNALYFAIGGVLMQEGHPIAFESRKLNDMEWHYIVQEKEMWEKECLVLEEYIFTLVLLNPLKDK